MPPQYRVAVLATGRIARAHARGYQMVPQTALCAAADVSPEARDAFGEEFEVAAERRYADYRVLLERERPDIVSVCSHPPLHAPMVLAAARHRPRAILCEKPIALTLPDADAMIDACREAGTLLVVGHQRRFAPQYVAAQRVIVSGVLGPIRLIEAYGHPGSSLLVDSTHTVDLLRFFLDEAPVAWVMGQVDARTAREAWSHPVEDATLAWIAFRNGVRVLLTAGGARAIGGDPSQGLGPPSDWGGRQYHQIIVHGRDARLEIDGDVPVGDRPLVRIHRGPVVDTVPLPWPPLAGHDWAPGQPLPEHVPPFAQEIHAVVDCLEGGGEHPLRAERARDALEILIAIYESARRRALVHLPVEVVDNPLVALRAASAWTTRNADPSGTERPATAPDTIPATSGRSAPGPQD